MNRQCHLYSVVFWLSELMCENTIVTPLRKYRALHQPKQGLATIAIFHTGMSLTFELKRQPSSTLYMDLKENISCHFFNNHSPEVSRASYFGVLNYF